MQSFRQLFPFKPLLFTLLICFLATQPDYSMGQGVIKTKMGYKKYLDIEYEQHLWGPFPLKVLQEDEKYSIWYNEVYSTAKWFHNPAAAKKLGDLLKNIEVDIYMGTWCEDSKVWVPSFVKLWDEMHLDTKKIHFIGISSVQEEGRYKTTPYKIEEGKYISHAPTIIFKDNNVELGRIVESPINGLTQDIELILSKKKSSPHYAGVLQIMMLLYENPVKQIKKKEGAYIKQLKKLVTSYRELDELSLIYRYRGEKEKALLIAHWNNKIFPKEQMTQTRVKNTESYFLKRKKKKKKH